MRLTKKPALTCTHGLRVKTPQVTQPVPWPVPAEEFRVGDGASEGLGWLSGEFVTALYRYSTGVLVPTPRLTFPTPPRGCSSRVLQHSSTLTKNSSPRQTRVLFAVEFLTAITNAIQGCFELPAPQRKV